MEVIGVICEYNPFHLGHQKQFQIIRQKFGDNCGIVCLMSGDYVQRGAPAILEKARRAEAAIRSGADLVLELPVNVSLSSAEGFALGGVKLLSPFCNALCFGAETMDSASLLPLAEALLSPIFPQFLKEALHSGCSFPAARQLALQRMGFSIEQLCNPNDILALEYTKAILATDSGMIPFPIHREGSYHDTLPDAVNPSATALRRQMLSGQNWLEYVPEEARDCFRNGPLYTLEAGERAILGLLRTMDGSDFEALPYGSEGLWRKLMHACREKATLEDILNAVKSKRYTRSRLDRMVMCAFLRLNQEAMNTPAPYTRVLALNDRGRLILRNAKNCGEFRNAGEADPQPYWEKEKKWGDLYGLFRTDSVAPPGYTQKQRIFYQP